MLENNFEFRLFDALLDAERIYQFRKDVEAIDHDQIDISLEAIKAQLEIPGHDLLRDREVVCPKGQPGKIIAYSSVWPAKDTADMQIVVHPAHRRLGIGGELLKRLFDRGNEMGVHYYNSYVPHTNKGGNTFLVNQDFVEQGAYTELHSSRLSKSAMNELPGGFTLRNYAEVNDPALMAEAMNESYRGLWGHREGAVEQVNEWVRIYPEEFRFLLFDPSDRLAGVCCTRMNSEVGLKNGQDGVYIDAPGLLPDYRNVRLYQQFLFTVLNILISHGAVGADMESWGDRSEVLRTYGEAGFEILRQSIAYKLER